MEHFGAFIQLSVPVFLLALAWFTGRTVEKRHFRRLDEQEQALSFMDVTNKKAFTAGVNPARHGMLVIGQVVIATDYLKTFLAGVRKVIGGELKSYETLMVRARREAMVRMLADAQKQGYNAVCNVRLEFCDIGSMTDKKGAAMVEVVAFGTAYHRHSESGA